MIKVRCQCGLVLFSYYKGGHGRLIKCFLDQIADDEAGVQGKETGYRPVCSSCGKVLGEIRMIRGRPALKINQGAIVGVRT